MRQRFFQCFLIVCLFILTLLHSAAPAFAQEPADAVIKEQARHVHTDGVEKYWNDLMQKYGGYFPDSKPPSYMDLLTGTGGFSLKTVLKGLARYFLHELIYNGKLLASIVILSIFSLILENIQSSFEKTTVSKIAYAITFMVLMIIAINSFQVSVGYAKTAITGMMDFMLAVVPVMLTLLMSMGSVSSVAVLHPLIVFMVHTVGTLIYFVIFPLLFFSAVLHIVSSLTDKYKVTQLANLLRSVSIGLLGTFVTIFLGVVSVQGSTRAVADGVTIKAAKYIAGNFVPVVGKMFADASDTVIGASLLMKNAVGITGVVVILFMCAFPALKILTLAFIYKMSAAVMQPLGDHPMVACLETIGKSMVYVFASLAIVSLMFFLAITIMVAVGNVSVMMR